MIKQIHIYNTCMIHARKYISNYKDTWSQLYIDMCLHAWMYKNINTYVQHPTPSLVFLLMIVNLLLIQMVVKVFKIIRGNFFTRKKRCISSLYFEEPLSLLINRHISYVTGFGTSLNSWTMIQLWIKGWLILCKKPYNSSFYSMPSIEEVLFVISIDCDKSNICRAPGETQSEASHDIWWWLWIYLRTFGESCNT